MNTPHHHFKVGDLLVFDRSHFSVKDSEWYIIPMLVLSVGLDWVEVQIKDEVLRTKSWIYMKKMTPSDRIDNSNLQDWQTQYIKTFEELKMYETLFYKNSKKLCKSTQN